MTRKELFFISAGTIILFSIVGFSAEKRSNKIELLQSAPEILDQEDFSWRKICHGLSEAEAMHLALAPDKAPALFVSTASAIYKATGVMAEGFASLYLEGAQRRVNQLYADAQTADIYAATDEGLYATYNKGKDWKKIYSAEKAKGQRCLSVLTEGPRIFLGTSTGLFYKTKGAQNWIAFDGALRDKSIFYLKTDKSFIYLGLPNEVFRLAKDLKGIKRIFSFIGHELDEDPNADSEDVGYAQQIRAFVVSQGAKPAVYIISTTGIFCSSDGGNNWQNVPLDSISLGMITSAVFYRDMLFVSGSDGAYFLKGTVWGPVYRGAETKKFNDLISDGQNALYAATAKGVFQLAQDAEPAARGLSQGADLDLYFLNEPTIRDVHKMAINYARVNPQKIGIWENQAQKKAWLPKLSMGLDSDRNRTVSDNVYGSYTGGGQSYIGPRDKTFYSNFGWDVSLSWDLGEVIWNPDQTSIDSRSKLMSELREDILNEITRIYFERRRLQIETLKKGEGQDEFYIERKMRIEELTALIDALTGGGFSEETEKGKNKYGKEL